MKRLFYAASIFALVMQLGWAALAFSKTDTKVGVLPFQVFSSEKVEYLRSLIPADLTRRLEEKGGFTMVTPEALQQGTALPTAAGVAPQELELIAKRTGADFLVYGSLTKIDENLSIDVRIFSAGQAGSPYKDFVEGKDLESLVETLAGKIVDHIAKIAPPPSAATPMAVAAPPEGEAAAPPAAASSPSVPESSAEPSGEHTEVSESVASAASESPEAPVAETALETSAPLAGEKTSAPKQKSLMPKTQFRSDQPINITSDRLEADNRAGTVNFLGNVVAKREDMVIFSDRISAFYNDQGGMQKIIARGNVKINQSDRVATCHEALYDQPTQKIILTGKPKVWQANNVVSGETITILLNEDKIIIEKGKADRVNATIFPVEKGSPGSGAKQ